MNFPPTPSAAVVTPESPWLGLRSFSEDTREYFFGRSAELEDLFERVRHRPLTVLFGQSGLGKTSLLAAGLVPRLRAAGWLPVVLRLRYDDAPSPAVQILAGLREALAAAGLPPLPPLSDALAAEAAASTSAGNRQPAIGSRAQQDRQGAGDNSADSLWLLFHDPALGFLAPAAPRPVFVFDQFEEIFTLGEQAAPGRGDIAVSLRDTLACLVENRPPPGVRARLEADDELAERLDHSAAPARFVLSLREDFLHRLERWRRQLPSLMDNRLELRLLTGLQALAAAVEPGRQRPAPLPPILSEEGGAAVVRFVAGVSPDVPLAEIDAVPPLLSLLCAELNERRLAAGQAQIDVEALAGKADDILVGFYERTLAAHPLRVRWFIEDRLLSEGGFRQPVNEDSALAELARVFRRYAVETDAAAKAFDVAPAFAATLFKETRAGGAPAAARATLNQLIAERLLTVEERGGLRRVELTHDILTRVAYRSRAERQKRRAALEAEEARRTREAREEAKLSAARHERKRLRRLVVIIVLVAALCAAAAGFGWSGRQRAEASARQAARDTSRFREAEEKGKILLAEAARNDVEEARSYFVRGAEARGSAHLVRSLRYDPLGPGAAAAVILLNGARLQPPEMIFLGHEKAVSNAVFSPDGSRMLTASDDKTARLWDPQTGRPLGEPLRHDREVTDAAFSPDGTRVATASADMTARLWDAQTGQPLGETMRHESALVWIAFSPDSQRIVTASADKTARLWDATSGKPLGEPMRHEKGLYLASFSPDGKRVVTASADRTARLWDAQTGRPLGEPMQHDAEVERAAFSPDGTQVVTTCADKTARLWDAQTSKPLGEPMRHEEPVGNVAFSSDGARVATGSGNTARIWDPKTSQLLNTLLGHEGLVQDVRFSPDGKFIATTSVDRTARLWDVQTGRSAGAPLPHGGTVSRAVFTADGTRLLTASADHAARLWKIQTGWLLSEPMRHEQGIISVGFSPDGMRVATASYDKTARLWDAATGHPVGEPMRHEGWVRGAAFSPDGTQIVTASYDHTARRWDAETGKPLGAPLRHADEVQSAAFSPDGGRLLTASSDHTARLWDARTDQPLGEPMRHESDVLHATFSPDGTRVATASTDQTARVWDARTGRPLGDPLRHEAAVGRVAFSPDGLRLLTLSAENSAYLWDLKTGRRLGQPMHHEEFISEAHFSPDGTRVVTASYDLTACVWDAQTGQPLIKPLRHEVVLVDAVFSPDGQRILTASRDNTARLWDASTGKALGSPLTHSDWLSSIAFSPDGRRVVTGSRDSTARIWLLPPPATEPPPAWFATFLRWHAQSRLDENGVFRYETGAEQAATRKEFFEALAAVSSDDESFYAQFVRRFLPPAVGAEHPPAVPPLGK